jgi:hypothetical protein
MTSSKRVLIIDTNLLCVWLKVPGLETCGESGDEWDFKRVDAEIKEALRAGFWLVLPLATLIETGNHIAHATQHRLERAKNLAEIMKKVADGQSPWTVFHHQTQLWSAEHLTELSLTWPPLAQAKLAMGDATIKKVSDYYAALGLEVRFLTADAQLMAHQPPASDIAPPRRRQRAG